eukprot:gene17038-18753_t
MYIAVLFVLLGLIPRFPINGQATACVSTIDEIDAMIDAAGQGDDVCIANGVYEDLHIKVGKQKNGITLKGENGGMVIMKGTSTIRIDGNSITVKNFVFTAPLSEGNSRDVPAPIEFGYNAEDCIVHDCMIHNHAADTWVRVRGKRNQVHHCSFINKPAAELDSQGKMLRISNIVSVSHSNMAKIQIHHNRLMKYKRSWRKHDGSAAVYVKIAKAAGRDTKNLECAVHNNYFYEVDSEEETIGIKASGNEIYRNALENCYGGISLRDGKNNMVRENFIQARKAQNNKDYGINVHNENHVVKDNWIMDVGKNHGLRVVGGNGDNSCVACHIRAKNVQLVNNTLVNSILSLGKIYPTGISSDPENIHIKDLTVSCSEGYAMISGYGLNKEEAFLGKPYMFEGNNRFYGLKIAYGEVHKS